MGKELDIIMNKDKAYQASELLRGNIMPQFYNPAEEAQKRLRNLQIENPVNKTNELIQEQTEVLQSELAKLQYENKMLNAQIQTANITVDRQLTELNQRRKSKTCRI